MPEENATVRAEGSDWDRYPLVLANLLGDIACGRYGVADDDGRVIEFIEDRRHIRYAADVEGLIRHLIRHGYAIERYGSSAFSAAEGENDVIVVEVIVTDRGAQMLAVLTGRYVK